MKGLGEGSYGWDLKPNSSMANATVANAVKGVDGHAVTRSRCRITARKRRSPSPRERRGDPGADVITCGPVALRWLPGMPSSRA
jgi:hypothetical protein